MAPQAYQYSQPSEDMLFGNFDMLPMQPLSPSALNLSNESETQQNTNFTRDVPQSVEGQVVAALEGIVALHKKTSLSQDESGQRLERKVAQLEQAVENLGLKVLARLNEIDERVAACNQQQSARSGELSTKLSKTQQHSQLMARALLRQIKDKIREVEGTIKTQFDELIKLDI